MALQQHAQRKASFESFFSSLLSVTLSVPPKHPFQISISEVPLVPNNNSVFAVPEGPIYQCWMLFMTIPQLKNLRMAGGSLIGDPVEPDIAKHSVLSHFLKISVLVFILAIRIPHLCWSLCGPKGAWGDHRRAAEVLFVYGAFAPPCRALGSLWHLEHHCNRKKWGQKERKKILFLVPQLNGSLCWVPTHRKTCWQGTC